jgi:hypothetical protein
MATKKNSKKTKATGKKASEKKLAAGGGSADAWLAGVSAAQADVAPNMPVKTAALEADRLAQKVKPYAARLSDLPTFHATVLADLPALIDAARSGQRGWERSLVAKGTTSLLATRKDAEEWRRDAIASARFLFRKDADMVAELDRIAAGDGVADLVDDLDDLVKIVRDNAKVFASVDEPVDADEGARLADTLRGGKDDEASGSSLTTRNRAFWALDAAVTEIRDGLRFLLRKNHKKLVPLLSHYQAVRRARARKSAKSKAATKKTDGAAAATTG